MMSETNEAKINVKNLIMVKRYLERYLEDEHNHSKEGME